MQQIQDAIALKQALLQDEALLARIRQVIDRCVDCFQNDGKVLFCGNGGSAADAQHLAAELSGRFYFDRPPLFAEALHVNTSYLTAVGNDYGYEASFARMAEAMLRKGDVIFLMSTSGKSPNILRAAEVAKKADAFLIGMTGQGGGELADLVDILLPMPSTDTPRIQEGHMLVGHIICEEVEKKIFFSQLGFAQL
ncbi:MAG: SIS domain-containing protein [Bacteroidota bacterium]